MNKTGRTKTRGQMKEVSIKNDEEEETSGEGQDEETIEWNEADSEAYKNLLDRYTQTGLVDNIRLPPLPPPKLVSKSLDKPHFGARELRLLTDVDSSESPCLENMLQHPFSLDSGLPRPGSLAKSKDRDAYLKWEDIQIY
jgi:hypothetical protein